MSERNAQSSEESSQVKLSCFDEKGTGHWKDWSVGGLKIASNRVLVREGLVLLLARSPVTE